MTPRYLLAFLGCALVTGCSCSTKSTAQDQDRLQGTWRAERVEMAGKVQDDEAMQGLTYTFEGDKLTVEVGGTRHEGNFVLDTGRSPHHIDLKPTAANKTDQPMQGLYEFDSGNNLRVCFSQKGRPGGLHTTSSGEILFELRRTPAREALVKMNATALLGDCLANRSVAAAKYKDQVLEVTGEVVSTKDGHVRLAAGVPTNYLECTFNQNYKSELFRAMKIRPEQRVTLRGTFSGAFEGKNSKAAQAHVQLLNCEVVDAAGEDKQ
jgi:uncharacterized protein (TIGR03067 family)